MPLHAMSFPCNKQPFGHVTQEDANRYQQGAALGHSDPPTRPSTAQAKRNNVNGSKVTPTETTAKRLVFHPVAVHIHALITCFRLATPVEVEK